VTYLKANKHTENTINRDVTENTINRDVSYNVLSSKII